MTDFEATGSVTLELDNLDQVGDDVQSEIERSIGSVTVATDGGGGGGGGRQRRRARQMLRATETQSSELSSQTELLEEILDELEDGGVGGGGGGGGGLLPSGLTGGLAARGLPGAGGLGAIGGLGALGAGGIGAGLGLGGVRLMQELGITEDIRGAGQDIGGGPGGSVLEALGLSTPAVDLGAASQDLAQGDLSFENLRTVQARRLDIIGDAMNLPGDIVDGNDPENTGSGGINNNRRPGPTTGINATAPGRERARLRDQGFIAESSDPTITPGEFTTRGQPGNLVAGPSGVDPLLGPAETNLGMPGGRAQRTGTGRAAPDARVRGGQRQLVMTGGDRSATPGGRVEQENTVNAPINIQVDGSARDLERQIDQKIEQAKREIMGEVNSAIPSELQSNFQGRIL